MASYTTQNVAGFSNLATGSLQTLLTVTAAKKAIVSLTVCNRGTVPVKIRWTITISATDFYQEYDYILAASATGQANAARWTGYEAPAGAIIKGQTDTANTDWTVADYEETA